MDEYATLHGVMTAQTWGTKVRRGREQLGISQTVAARRAGLSPSGWRNLEKGVNVGLPERSTVLKICSVLGWDPDAELRDLGLEPMTDDERTAPHRDPDDELRRLWPSLTEPQRWALVYTAATMVTPRQWPEIAPEGDCPPDVEVWTADLPHVQGPTCQHNPAEKPG